jgi:hypothetical protein
MMRHKNKIEIKYWFTWETLRENQEWKEAEKRYLEKKPGFKICWQNINRNKYNGQACKNTGKNKYTKKCIRIKLYS